MTVPSFRLRDARAQEPTPIQSSESTSTGLGSLQQTSSSASSTASPTALPDVHSPNSPNTTAIAIGTVVGCAVAIFFAIVIVRGIRKHRPEPKYLPTSFFRRLRARWRSDSPCPLRDASGLEALSATSRQSSSTFPEISSTNTAAGVDRHTSVRSVMTLPAYASAPNAGEQVLGREGERDGIDTIVEFPESEIAAERQRDEEMEALYQVRLARRTEAAEREERRRLRAEARARGDTEALRTLRDSRHVSQPQTEQGRLEAARAFHEAIKSRERAVSSVSYGDLGVARHDGTRIRANSEESERPLLGDAASMGVRRPSNVSHLDQGHSLETMASQGRNRSRSSVLSLDTMGSDLAEPRFPASRSRASSAASIVSIGGPRTGTIVGDMSSPEIIDVDAEGFPRHDPPEYVNVALDETNPANIEHNLGQPPQYFSPVDTRAPEFPQTEARIQSQSVIVDNAVLSPSTEGSGQHTPGSASSIGSGSRRGVGLIPQLPSLRLSNLPSIQIDSGTPIEPARSASQRRHGM